MLFSLADDRPIVYKLSRHASSLFEPPPPPFILYKGEYGTKLVQHFFSYGS